MELLTHIGEHHEIGDGGWLTMTRRQIPLSGALNGLQISPLDEEQEVAAAPYHKMRWIILSDFFLRETEYIELELRSVEHQGAHETGGRAPHPRGQGVGPLVFIFGEDFLLFILRYSVELQVIPRTFVFCT